MKAKTKNQKRVVQLDKKFSYDPGVRVKNWAKENLFEHRAIRYKSGTINCLKCGHDWKSDLKQAWQDEIVECKCPKCKRTLKVKATQNRTDRAEDYLTIITTNKEYQVIRTFYVSAAYKCKQEPTYFFNEGIRIYIREDGKREVMGCLRGGMYYSSFGGFNGSMELRNPQAIDQKYGTEGLVYPKVKIHDYLTEKGANIEISEKVNYTFGCIAYALLKYTFAETLLKDDRIDLFIKCLRNHSVDRVKKYWATIKICMRNKYPVPDASSYFDMLGALEFFNKDLHNAKYVCPNNFKKAHDYWIKKKSDVLEAQRQERLRLNRIEELKRQKAEKLKYNRRMKKFAKLCFVTDNIKIIPLMTLDHVAKAGDLMHHCIFSTSSYWKDKDNLLLGTYNQGKLIETTQYSLTNKRVLHSYGHHNQPSKYHKELVRIIHGNRPMIDRMAKSKKRVKQVA